MRSFNPVYDSLIRTTRSADHTPMPLVPIQAADLLLPVPTRKHDHSARWFWTGFLIAVALIANVTAVVMVCA